MQDHKPWELLKGGEVEKAVCGTVIKAALGLALLLAALIEPFMPSVTTKAGNFTPSDQCSLKVFTSQRCTSGASPPKFQLEVAGTSI